MGGTDVGFNARAQELARRNPIELVGKIFHDFFLQPKYFPPNVSFKIKLRRTSQEFALLSADSNRKYSIDFENVILYVKRVLVQDSIMHSHQLLMTHHNALYPFTDTNIKSIPIAKNSVNVIVENIFPHDKQPSKILFGFITNDAFNGSMSLTPYNFKHFNLSSVSLNINNYESRKKQLNFDV